VTWSWEVAERNHEIQDPTSAERHVSFRDNYIRKQRAELGWAIFVGRKD
jgi:hypothetical protein